MDKMLMLLELSPGSIQLGRSDTATMKIVDALYYQVKAEETARTETKNWDRDIFIKGRRSFIDGVSW